MTHRSTARSLVASINREFTSNGLDVRLVVHINEYGHTYLSLGTFVSKLPDGWEKIYQDKQNEDKFAKLFVAAFQSAFSALDEQVQAL